MHVSAFLRAENYDPRNVPRAASNTWWEVVGVLHRRSALERFPELSPSALDPCRAELADDHEAYVREVSSPEYAISLELATFLLALCRHRRPARLLDLGSGFSSFVFRRHQAESEPRPQVWSVDDDPAWRERTRRYLADRGLALDHVVGPDELLDSGVADFDLVLHDLNTINSPERSQLLPAVLGALAGTGVLVVDDLDGYPYRGRVRAAAARSGHRLLSLRPFLVDERWRYPGALVREAPPGFPQGPGSI